MDNALTVRDIENLIFEFRGMKVMVDTDLAVLYETETKKLKQQVKRNIDRFPHDFMFELSKEEKEQLITMAPRLSNLKHSSVNPLVFTEQGVSMLSSVLRTDKAVQVNIGIMRAFAYYRKMILENHELKKEIKLLDAKLNKAFKYLLDKIDALKPKLEPKPRKPIGYKRNDKEE
jgi:histidyl-tRNA synthetase